MRVLYLLNIPSPYRVNFLDELGKNCELTVLYERASTKVRDATWLNQQAIHHKSIVLKSWKIRKEDALAWTVRRHLKDPQYDVIVVGGYSTPTGMLAIWSLYRMKKPFILNTDGGIPRLDKGLRRWVKRFFINKAFAFLSPSPLSDRYLNTYVDAKKTIYRYPFTSLYKKDCLNAPPTLEQRAQYKQTLKLPYEQIILAIGQFIPRKNFETLIKASIQLEQKNVGIIIIGGDSTSSYETLVQTHQITNIHFKPFMQKEALKTYFLASDLFVLPTLEDIWGLVINEAMAHALPIITTHTCGSGVALVENGKNGFLVDATDTNALAQRMNLILGNRKLKYSLSENALKSIQQYTLENMAHTHVEHFQNFLTAIKTS